MPKTKKRKAAKAVRTVKKLSKFDNRLVIAALVLLLAVAIFMLVESWTGIL